MKRFALRTVLFAGAATVAFVFPCPSHAQAPPGTVAPVANAQAQQFQVPQQGGTLLQPSEKSDIMTTADGAPPPVPQDLSALEKVSSGSALATGGSPLTHDLRYKAMREAALSYGARGGLAWRTYHIRQELEARAPALDKVFDFRGLLVAAPSGLMIEPPVISEEVNAMIIDAAGTQAAVADRIYDISNNARIVSAARSWRNYLERDWGAVPPPPQVLIPQDESERKKWKDWVKEGWDKGVVQADEIFQDDLNQLTADYKGMVRYRTLLAQGMVTPPYAMQTDRGVTGGGKIMRIGDRAVQITGMPELVSGSEAWQPAGR